MKYEEVRLRGHASAMPEARAGISGYAGAHIHRVTACPPDPPCFNPPSPAAAAA